MKSTFTPIDRALIRSTARILGNKGVLILSLLLLSGVYLSKTDAAFADVCRRVRIRVTNHTTDPVRITKLEYFDYDKNKFRTEGLSNLFNDPEIGARQGAVVQQATLAAQNFNFIGNERTFLRITYQHRISNFVALPVAETTEQFICQNDSTRIVNLTK